jgi:hypothetical protein
MESAGAGAGEGPKKASMKSFQAAIRWVFNMGEGVTLDDFIWRPVKPTEQILYRGQCGTSSKAIERRGTTPLQLRTNLVPPKPIATSKLLSQKILEFSCPARKEDESGRIFEIHVKPGVLVTTMYDQIPAELSLPYTKNKKVREAAKEKIAPLVKEAFSFLSAELPKEHGLKKAKPNQLYGLFFRLLHKEKEVLLDPRSIQFVQEDGSLETDWSTEEIPAVVYEIDERGDKVKEEGSDEFVTLGEIGVYKTFVEKKVEGGKRRQTRKKKRGVKKQN